MSIDWLRDNNKDLYRELGVAIVTDAFGGYFLQYLMKKHRIPEQYKNEALDLYPASLGKVQIQHRIKEIIEYAESRGKNGQLS